MTSEHGKWIFNQFSSWNFQYTIESYLLGEPGVSTDQRKTCLPSTSKLNWVRISLWLFAVFCYLFVCVPPRDESPMISAFHVWRAGIEHWRAPRARETRKVFRQPMRSPPRPGRSPRLTKFSSADHPQQMEAEAARA